MLIVKNTLTFLFLLILSLSLHAEKLRYKFEQVTPVSGISFTGVTCVHEDKNGFIWAGGETGLFFYDGMNFKHYQQEEIYDSGLPYNQIFDIAVDSNNVLWVGTSNGLVYFDPIDDEFRNIDLFDGKRVDKFVQFSENKYIVLVNKKLCIYDSKSATINFLKNQPENISTFHLFSDCNILVGTEEGEVGYVDLSDSIQFKHIYRNHEDKITAICRDNEWLYLGYENSGIEVINTAGNLMHSYNIDAQEGNLRIPSNNVRAIVKRDNGEIWIGTYDGLAILSGDDVSVFNNVNSSLPSSSIYDIFIDSKNNIWLGTWSGGLARYSPESYRLGGEIYYLNNKTKVGVVTSFVSSKYMKCIWVGTENNGLYLYDYSSSDFIKRIYPVPFHIKTLLRHENKIFIGAVEGVWEFDEYSGNMAKINIRSFANVSPIVSSMLIKNDILYIATRSCGILEYNLKTNEEILYSTVNNTLNYDAVWQLYVDNQNNVYACTNRGFVVKKENSKIFEEVDIAGNIGKVLFYCVIPLNYEELLLGSRNKGIFVYNIPSGKLKPFTVKTQMGGVDVYSLMSLGKSGVWASTNKGIIDICKEGENIYRYDEADGVIGCQFHPLSSCLLEDGTAFWGSTVGFNYINIANIRLNTLKPQVFPVSIKINNHLLSNLDEVKVNSNYVPEIREMEMPYYLNSLSFRVSANNLLNSVKNKLKYRLEGYQDEWTTIQQSENIIFTQVPPGKYTLCVYGANNDMVWGDKELRIKIFIHPPFYATGYAYLAYSILTVVLLYFIYRNIKFRVRALQEISSERNRSRINKAIVEERTKFFMNISHELRTPLNLIVAPMKILREKHFDKETMFHLDVIYRNTERLRHLTEQILDFRLLEMDKMKANKKNTDLVPLCKDIISEFDYFVKKKNVNLNFSSDSLMRYVNCDSRMIEKVIYNLLSNAFKYTGNDPEITLDLKKVKLSEDSYKGMFYVGNRFYGLALQISVSDNGDGIESDKFEAIFERFNTYHNENQDGSGIGLHLCKEYVALHDGNIMLRSEKGIGSSFIVCLPLITDENQQESSAPILISQKQTDVDNIVPDNGEIPVEVNSNSKTVLIIEDNDEVVFYLKKSLSARYRCLIAKNGKAGFEMATSVIPDIIVMDYMMPLMDGTECTKSIRGNSKTRNIPIIVLSGAADFESQRRIINAGADIFLTKPVDEDLLMEHISKLLAKAAKLNDIIYDAVPQSFMDKLDFYISRNIKDPDFDVEALAACLHLSRSSLFRRIKAETGYNISEYLREKRLVMAIELINSGQTNVEELSLSCGFNSSSYFCKCFKAKYGVPPKEYIKSRN